MELCLLNLLILIDCFLCNSYPCVLFESLSHVINQESHIYSWNLKKIWKISKFQKSELGKFIPNFPLKHVITSTNHKSWSCRTGSHKKYSKTWKYSQNGSSWQQNITQDRKSFITNSNLYFDFYILLTKAFTMLGFNVFYYAGFFF